MSEQKEDLDTQKVPDTAEGSAEAYPTINIPGTSEEVPKSDQTEDNESKLEPSDGGHGTHVEEQSDHGSANLESNKEEQVIEEAMLSTQVSNSSVHGSHSPAQSDDATESPKQHSNDYLELLNKIKAVKKSLRTSLIDSLATVKVVLLPVGQEIFMPFNIDIILKYFRDHFSHLLNVPSDVLQLRCAGRLLRNNETLLQHGVKPQDTVQVEIFSALPDQYPIRRLTILSDANQVIPVRVQTGVNQYQQVVVEMIKSDFHKPFLGGFRHKITGTEYHNAGTQTVPKKCLKPDNLFSRDTQTVFQRKKLQQTTNTTSTQMTKIGVYVSNMTDKLITPGKYFSAAEYHAQRLAAVIVLQTYYRQWHAKIVVENLRKQKQLRLQWEEEAKLKKIAEKEEWKKMDYYRRHNPQTKEDFELLYDALEFWRQEELARINECFTGPERKAALCELLEKETQIIASIGRHRYASKMANQEAVIEAFLSKCSAPKTWERFDGNIIEMDTQFTIRARELQSIYRSILLKNISQDERLDILLTLKHTVKEHECKLTREILELIDREVDLMMRRVKDDNLAGLRKRIATLFLHYIKTPLFNPEVARHLKVPPDPLKFLKKIYFCHSCQLYLPSTEFVVSSTTNHINRCRKCISLDNETRQRESFLKYKCLLQRLYYLEADYEDDSMIAFLMQLEDIQYLTEHIWAAQSALSAWNDLDDLVMVRWDKAVEWSPWNCILLTKEEGAAHLRLTHAEEGYVPLFIHKIKHKHILAKNYFSQIPILNAFILDDVETDEIRKKHEPETSLKIIESQRPSFQKT
ncbi:IQ motif and ubiquitin-like domain-containing protein isoform X1 [Saccopteryx bilineata]|uniref:IQ motif and ubiquitin-like domain-containing protein isoform X1 n=1 Tax=Saccopteryx bilineata TaxID=59482 RepID=UPI00338F5DE6